MGETKSIAVLVRKRVSEALRMSVGLTVLNDRVSVYIAEPVAELDDMAAQYLEALSMMDVPVFSVHDLAGGRRLSEAELAAAVLEADSVIAY